MPNYLRLPVSFTHGEGAYLYDEKGKRYLDFVSGIGVCSLGHAHPALVKALKKQTDRLLHVSNLYENPWQEELARELVTRFWTRGRVFFCNSGTESVEAALKLARKYWRERGVNRWKFVTLLGSFHGRTYGSLSATGQPKLHEGFEPMLEGFTYVPPEPEALRKAVDEETAAVLVELIQGEGGVRELPPEFIEALAELREREKFLLIVDEVQTGVGRTGSFYAYEQTVLRPDVITLAKGLGGGVPIGATLAREEVALAFKPSSHGSTFGGNPLACRAGLTVVKEVSGLLPRVREVGALLKEELKKLNKGEVRGRGLMLGIELPYPCKEVVLKALERGLLVNCTAERVVRLLPPLILTEEQALEGVEILKEVL
ncbi:MAG: aspartate aminotransferase family protein [Aquificae bacterium]|nr:aspartate aminotransferase family protein [Aquificota bacterium]